MVHVHLLGALICEEQGVALHLVPAGAGKVRLQHTVPVLLRESRLSQRGRGSKAVTDNSRQCHTCDRRLLHTCRLCHPAPPPLILVHRNSVCPGDAVRPGS
jgi:hypothetical protein